MSESTIERTSKYPWREMLRSELDAFEKTPLVDGRKMTMSEFAIENGIEMPGRPGRTSKYPWREMLPGQSFFIPGNSNSKNLYRSASMASKQNGCKFSCRRVEGGMRIWRVE